MKLEAIRADTNVYSVVVLRRGLPVDITGAKIWFSVKTSKTEIGYVFSINSEDDASQFAFTNPTKGQATITLLPGDTDFITRDTTFYYDVQIREAGGRISTAQSGKLLIRMDVT